MTGNIYVKKQDYGMIKELVIINVLNVIEKRNVILLKKNIGFQILPVFNVENVNGQIDKLYLSFILYIINSNDLYCLVRICELFTLYGI